MNTYLHSLPFQKDKSLLSSCVCPKQGFDPPGFKLYSEADRFPTFVLRLPIIGENPDLTYANECVALLTANGEHVSSYTMNETGTAIFKDSASYYIIYDGRAIPGLKMDCESSYRLLIADCYSEAFWITSTPTEKIRLEFSNKSQLGDVPYQQGFVQKILIDGEICSLSAEMFENRKTETNGTETITYQKMTVRSGLQIFSAPDFIAELVSSSRIHEGFKVIYRNNTIEPLKKQSEPTPTQNGCCDYDIDVILPTREIKIIGGNCQTDVDTDLVRVEIPEDLPNSCDVDEDWTPTDTVICLKKGQSPPVIDVPIVRIIPTPPVSCPPLDFLLGNQTFKVPCTTPWIKDGVNYSRKVVETRADGDCGTTQVELFYDPCADVPQDSGSVTVVNVICGDVTPPSETTQKPSWLLNLGYTHDVASHQFTLWEDATEDVEIQVGATLDPQPTGLSNNDQPFNNTTWLPGDSEFAGEDYSELTRLNPVTYGVEGILPNKEYFVRIRRTASPGSVYKYTFTTKSVSNPYPPTNFVLTDPDLPSCSLEGGRPPTILGVLQAVSTSLTFQFDAEHIFRFLARLMGATQAVRSTTFVLFSEATYAEKAAALIMPNPTVTLFTSNTPTWVFGAVDAGTYNFEIEGATCKSDSVSIRPVTIAATALAFVAGYPNYSDTGADFTLRIRVNKQEPFNTRVVNTANNQDVYNQTFDYTGDATLSIEHLQPGVYGITVATITYNITISESATPGSYVPVRSIYTLKENMDIVCTGSSENWVFSDLSNMQVPDDSERVYMMAGKLVYRGKGKLTNAVYQSNNPVIIKMMWFKLGAKQGDSWSGGAGDDKYTTQPPNQSCSTTIYLFKPVL